MPARKFGEAARKAVGQALRRRAMGWLPYSKYRFAPFEPRQFEATISRKPFRGANNRLLVRWPKRAHDIH